MATETKEKQSVAKGFQPLGDRVFVTYTEEMERTAGGIYVPESAKVCEGKASTGQCPSHWQGRKKCESRGSSFIR
jgi:co-chaperonin GroES (HSP10)